MMLSLTSIEVNLSEDTKQLLRSNLAFGKAFCPLPFLQIHKDIFDQLLPCCWSNKDPLNDQSLNDLRSNMLNDKVSPICALCTQEEQQKRISPRQRQIKGVINNPEILDKPLSQFNQNQTVEPIWYDLRFNNLCNLACQTCGPECSSKLGQLENKPSPFINRPLDVTINPAAEKIYMAGGEPFLIKEYSRMLTQVQNVDCKININTNCTILTDHMLKALDRFNDILFTISIDGYGELNERIRRFSNWSTIERNIDTLYQRYGSNKRFDSIFHVNTVLQKDNINHLLPLAEWIQNRGFKHWNLSVCYKPKIHHYTQAAEINIPAEIFELPIVKNNLQVTTLLRSISCETKQEDV